MLRSALRTTYLHRVFLRSSFSSSSILSAASVPESNDSPPLKRRRGRLPQSLQTSPVDPKERITLPDLSDWRAVFPPQKAKDRISISNPNMAAKAAEQFVPDGSKDKVVIEAFPGPGALTRALLALPKSRIRKLIVVENHKPYLDYLYPLADTDPRLVVIPMNAFAWEAYQFIEESGELNGVATHPWDEGLHPHLQYISHIPLQTMGEQFVAQTLRCIPDQSWFFKFGRVPFNLILSEWVWTRLSAEPTSSSRCKLTIIAEATTTADLSFPPATFTPYDDHFHPTVSKHIQSGPWTAENRRIGAPFVAVDFKPLEKQPIRKGMLDKWDYCLRRLYVMKSTPLKTAISHLAPGAGTLVKTLAKTGLSESETLDVKKPIKAMTVHDWALLLKAFDEWPFAPEDLLVTDGFIKDDRRLG